MVRVFPALFQRAPQPAAPTTAAEGEGTCFDHPTKLAIAHCSQCGRFLCPLCAVDFRGGIWCPTCISAGVTRKRSVEFENSRTLYDSIALAISTLPLLLWPFTFLGAPAALFMGIRFWRRPLSLVRRYRWRMALAILFATAEIVAWVWGIVYLILHARGSE
jgi:hypothetical protein